MKNKLYLMVILYLLFPCSGSLFCVGEKTISLGGGDIWTLADYKTGITEANLVRAGSVLLLSSGGEPRADAAKARQSTSMMASFANPWGTLGLVSLADKAKTSDASTTRSAPLDLYLSFDEGRHERFRDSAGNYQIYTSPSLSTVDRRYARSGSGAALFSGSDINRKDSYNPLTVKAQSNSALFAANKRIRDFSLEFWLNPQNLENGEQILLWISSLPAQSTRGSRAAAADHIFQRILCVSSKNRLQWSFLGFFLSPDTRQSLDIIIRGQSAIVPKTWSHHLIRFDSITGMIEYSVNGKVEAIDYATSTRREGGEVYTPVAGEGGEFVLGGDFSGLMDEFMIHSGLVPGPAVQKYPPRGRIETGPIDLGDGSNSVLKIEASGGRTQIQNAKTGSEYKRNGRFLFSDDSEMQFFIRGSNNPYRWDSAWHPVTPGSDIGGSVIGRYVQLAVDFYPSADGEASPYLEELRVTYLPDEPPLPPTRLTAVAMDGAVQLQWRSSPDANTQGYLVYYGSTGGEYFGEDAASGISPVDVGKRNSVIIEGLKNGTLYYFRVAAYSNKDPDKTVVTHAETRHIGDLSAEARARPLTGIKK